MWRQKRNPVFSVVRRFLSDESRKSARRDRARLIAEKQAEVEAYLESLESRKAQVDEKEEDVQRSKAELEKEKKQREEWMEKERQFLTKEAGFMTRALYRTCFRSIGTIRPGNAHDEAQFRALEEKQKKEQEEGTSFDGTFSMSPPVNRENELSSRAEYYRVWARENFDQESDCLDNYPWNEDALKRYVHYLRYGEEQRQWILNDYKFEDRFTDRFDQARLDRFEERANKLLLEIYKDKDWMYSTDLERIIIEGNDEDDIFDEEEVYKQDEFWKV